ncbi:hypothetical protein Tco_0672403 [Tanacetum coccineum]
MDQWTQKIRNRLVVNVDDRSCLLLILDFKGFFFGHSRVRPAGLDHCHPLPSISLMMAQFELSCKRRATNFKRMCALFPYSCACDFVACYTDCSDFESLVLLDPTRGAKEKKPLEIRDKGVQRLWHIPCAYMQKSKKSKHNAPDGRTGTPLIVLLLEIRNRKQAERRSGKSKSSHRIDHEVHLIHSFDTSDDSTAVTSNNCNVSRPNRPYA